MKTALQEALRQTASDVLAVISNDPFPSAIYPECLRSAVRSYPVRGGKRIRPALVLWSCGALGGDPKKAMNAAVATEIYHSWTLVHDDIIDEDELRRGSPTTHMELAAHAAASYRRSPACCGKFGRDMAILAGDIQQAWAIDLLMRSVESGCSTELVMALTRNLQSVVNRGLISGEALDVELPMRDLEQISEGEVLKTITGKTVCLLQFCVQTGGAIALNNADPDQPALRILADYADAMGIAFQLRDDYLGVFGDLKTFGKPLGSDFQEGKPTLMFLDALNHLPPAGKKELLALTGLPEYPADSICRIRALLEDSGSADRILRKIAGYTDRAMQSLNALPDNPYRQLLIDLTAYLLDRDV